jgi:hypothetical protein
VKKRLGCLTPGGIAAALLTLAVAGTLLLLRGGTIFSPGALNAQAGGQVLGGVASHAETGGRCAACHPEPWSGETMADRCLACHEAVADEMRDMASLHGKLTGEGEAACRDCHPEHRGSLAALTEVDAAAFPHETTGYSLEAHQETAGGDAFACGDCHGEDLLRFEPSVCTGCHRELDAAYVEDHVADFGHGCLACHDGSDSYGSDFDHDALAFALEGQHESAACRACHQGARSTADLRATPGICYGCHAAEDAHGGEFGPDCATCHTAENWQDATFDHARTDFALTGAHVEVECAGCHGGEGFQGAPTDCYGCHPDPAFHAGLFSTDCAACHDTAAWTPAGYDEPHTFPFDHGEEGISPCRRCHPQALETYTCYECHEHEPAEVEREHLEEGIRDFQDCVECHPTGREDEAEEDDD